ncbi:MAG: cytochrome P450 [Acidimicrobiales bacterium]|nr:cytochrome P450 [Acidimicrobiales bacterium]
MATTELPELYYDPYDYGIDRNAPAVWARLRDEAPLYRNDEHDFWAVSRYDDVLAGMLDVDTYRSGHGTVLEMMTEREFPMPMFIFRDAPDHTLMRKLVSRAFTPRAIGGLEDRIAAICDELLDPFAGVDRFDYVDRFGAILPPTVILALLGFPAGFAEDLRDSMDSNLHVDEGETGGALATSPNRPPGSVIDEAGNIGSAVFDQVPALCELRRAEPTDDMLTILATHELERADGSTSPLTTEEILAYTALIAGAGAETVARMLGWAAVLLARHPEQRALLQADRSLIPGAIEEILRYEAPSPVQARWVEHDVDVHGTTIPAGSKMLLLNGSGNRDPRQFPDPDRFDVRRKIDRHLSFGYGAHFCIGAALARLEGRIALEQTLDRFGDWHVDESEVEWVHTSTVRGYHRVPIQVSN